MLLFALDLVFTHPWSLGLSVEVLLIIYLLVDVLTMWCGTQLWHIGFTLWVLYILPRSWRTGWSSILNWFNLRSLQFVLSLPAIWSLVLLERIVVRSFAFGEGGLYRETSSWWPSFPFSLSNYLLLLDLEFLDFSTWASHGQLAKIEWTKELHFSFILFLLLIHLVKLLSNFLFEVPNPLFVYLHIVLHFLDACIFLVECLLSLDTDLFHCIMCMFNLSLEYWYLQLMLLLELLDLLFMILLAFYQFYI